MHVFIILHFDVVAYFDGIFFLSHNGEESFNTFLSPNPDSDPDHLRGGPSHGDNFIHDFYIFKTDIIISK